MSLHKYSFTGWLKNIGEVTNQGTSYTRREVVIGDTDMDGNDESGTADQNPNDVTFALSSKYIDAFSAIPVGSKVKVGFYLTGFCGVSKKTNKPYAINRLSIGKDIEVLELASVPKAEGEQTEEEEPKQAEDLPF